MEGRIVVKDFNLIWHGKIIHFVSIAPNLFTNQKIIFAREFIIGIVFPKGEFFFLDDEIRIPVFEMIQGDTGDCIKQEQAGDEETKVGISSKECELTVRKTGTRITLVKPSWSSASS